MKLNQFTIRILKLAVLLVCFYFLINSQPCCTISAESEQTTQKNEVQKAPAKQLIVTYFHTSYRCPTCKKIEAYSKEAVEKNFDKELKDQKVVYRVLDMTAPENKHYIEDYKLVTKSVVLSITDNGKEIKWKNLPDIWTTIKNKDKFDEYILKEIREYMKEI